MITMNSAVSPRLSHNDVACQILGNYYLFVQLKKRKKQPQNFLQNISAFIYGSQTPPWSLLVIKKFKY
mgnify:CR=1 FL=1